MKETIFIYDCGCVPSRPTENTCKSYGTRWRVYKTPTKIILRCRDCRKKHIFNIVQTKLEIQLFGWSR
jgi:hypothetical protein